MAMMIEHTINDIVENTHYGIDSLEVKYFYYDLPVEIIVKISDGDDIIVAGEDLQDATNQLAEKML